MKFEKKLMTSGCRDCLIKLPTNKVWQDARNTLTARSSSYGGNGDEVHKTESTKLERSPKCARRKLKNPSLAVDISGCVVLSRSW